MALLSSGVAAFVWHEGVIEREEAWPGEGWAGGEYTVELSHDGSKVMLVGYGGPDEVRVLDREFGLVGTWEPPGENMSVEGASWATSDDMISVWGSNGSGPDFLSILSVPGFDPLPVPNMTYNNTLVDFTYARLAVDGIILVVGGRCQHDSSRLQVVEVGTDHLINDLGWKENATIVDIEADGIYFVVVDERGSVTSIETRQWNEDLRWEGSGGPPTAESIGDFAGDRIWIVGYTSGGVRVFGHSPIGLVGEADTGSGPVLGIASLFPDPRYYAVAVPDEDGGTGISGWIHNDTWGEKLWSNTVEEEARALSMHADPMVPGRFLAAFDDGSIATYSTTIQLNMPPSINFTSEVPEDWVGMNTVTGEVYDEAGIVLWTRYRFNNAGEWMDAEGTSEFSITFDADDFQPSTQTITVWTSDGVHEAQANYDFHIYQPEDDESNFWTWFSGSTILVLVVLLVVVIWTYKRRGTT